MRNVKKFMSSFLEDSILGFSQQPASGSASLDDVDEDALVTTTGSLKAKCCSPTELSMMYIVVVRTFI